MRRLTRGGAETLTGVAALLLVTAVLALATAYLADGRADLADRRMALMAASARIGVVPLRVGPSVAVIPDRDGCGVETDVRILAGSGREVAVTATTSSGESVRLVRRFADATDDRP